jgi:hypothetical protein
VSRASRHPLTPTAVRHENIRSNKYKSHAHEIQDRYCTHFYAAVWYAGMSRNIITPQSGAGYTFSYFSKFLHSNNSTGPHNRSLPLPATSITNILIFLMMEAAETPETLLNFYQTTRRYNPEGRHYHPITSKQTCNSGVDVGP